MDYLLLKRVTNVYLLPIKFGDTYVATEDLTLGSQAAIF